VRRMRIRFYFNIILFKLKKYTFTFICSHNFKNNNMDIIYGFNLFINTISKSKIIVSDIVVKIKHIHSDLLSINNFHINILILYKICIIK